MKPSQSEAVQQARTSSSTAITTAGDAPPPAVQPARQPPIWTVPVTGLLFVAWLGYLIYLVAIKPSYPLPDRLVLSRPQFLVSDLDVVAHIQSTEGQVIVKDVINPKTEEKNYLVGQPIIVTNLQTPMRKKRKDLIGLSVGLGLNFLEPILEPHRDFVGPRDYILPLRPSELGQAVETVGLLGGPAGPLIALATLPLTVDYTLTYEIVPTPWSPTYPRDGNHAGPPNIYPAIPATLAQLKQIKKP